MLNNYLSKKVIVSAGILSFLFFFFGFFLISFFGTAMLALLLLAFRKNRVLFRENPPTLSEGVLYSPVNGRVAEIRNSCKHKTFGEELTLIKIIIPPWKEMGVYLPFSSEVRDLVVENGKPYFRWSKQNVIEESVATPGLSICLASPEGEQIGLHIMRCVFGGWPEIAVMPGDRGKRQVNIGHIPFGGTLLLYLPPNYEILISEGDDVLAGETLVAGLKEK
ncbi:MAG: hypothetical protein HN509_05505 [Halobacteriovoraceae bacterium]|jgi:hypothetical protein|nr:hypothetical protein [Halobacteriovoraceae bacterium]MBT5093810.1 hypothetical protein [Halobacteriovoraceae bacterium]